MTSLPGPTPTTPQPGPAPAPNQGQNGVAKPSPFEPNIPIIPGRP